MIMLGDKVRWSRIYLRSLGIEPSEKQLIGFITAASEKRIEVCFEDSHGAIYLSVTPQMLEKVDA